MVSSTPKSNNGDDQQNTCHKFIDFISTLPKEKSWLAEDLHQYQGIWYPAKFLPSVISLQNHFEARSTDVLLATYPKSGTTWLKALAFSIINRTHCDDYHTHSLLTSNPHDCVPYLESYSLSNPTNPTPETPLMATHIPYTSLPKSVLDSKCQIVYAFREPKDVFVSLWYFASKLRSKELPPISIEEAFELFCKGVSPYGPSWDHVMGYWKASLEWPERVRFLEYEDLMRDPFVHAKRLAEFLGHPFTPEEEREGVVHKIIKLCSFENLSNLEVNKTGMQHVQLLISNNLFFREGKVGDWQNHITAEMGERLDQITEQKFEGYQV